MSDNTPTEGDSGFTTREGVKARQGSSGITTEPGPFAQGIQTTPPGGDGDPADAVYEATEVVANFMDEDQAQPALLALRAAGIPAVLSGAVPTPATFSLFGRFQYAPMQLAVPHDQVAEAERILTHLDAPPELGWEEVVEQAIDGWLCHNCDTVVPEVETDCPECGTVRGEQPPPGAE
jgi:hypothetical protein